MSMGNLVQNRCAIHIFHSQVRITHDRNQFYLSSRLFNTHDDDSISSAAVITLISSGIYAQNCNIPISAQIVFYLRINSKSTFLRFHLIKISRQSVE